MSIKGNFNVDASIKGNLNDASMNMNEVSMKMYDMSMKPKYSTFKVSKNMPKMMINGENKKKDTNGKEKGKNKEKITFTIKNFVDNEEKSEFVI